MNTKPIGIFDSGIGGTSILKEIHQLLPHEQIIYLADSKYAPYGNKSPEDIVKLSIKNTELLLEKGAKLIVVACNTATTNAISYLRTHYAVPFIGIEPAIKPAALKTKTKAIGILATKGTLSSALFHKTMHTYAQSITIIEQIGEGIVPRIEAGAFDTTEMRELLQKYISPMLKAGIDYLVLGCTHYPYLKPILNDLLPSNVIIIDSGGAVAKQTKAILEKYNIRNTTTTHPKIQLYSNTDTSVLTAVTNTAYNVSYLDF